MNYGRLDGVLKRAADTLFPEAGEAGPSMDKPCADCRQQFGDYCLLACPFGKRKSDAD